MRLPNSSLDDDENFKFHEGWHEFGSSLHSSTTAKMLEIESAISGRKVKITKVGSFATLGLYFQATLFWKSLYLGAIKICRIMVTITHDKI